MAFPRKWPGVKFLLSLTSVLALSDLCRLVPGLATLPAASRVRSPRHSASRPLSGMPKTRRASRCSRGMMRYSRGSAPRSSYHFALLHDWGVKGANHKRVRNICDTLEKRGIRCFLDEYDVRTGKGPLPQQCLDAIDNSQIVLMCITENYVKKVSSNDANDVCLQEIRFALQNKNATSMIPIVMEPSMLDTDKWGDLTLNFGNHKYIDFSKASRESDAMDELTRYAVESSNEQVRSTQAQNRELRDLLEEQKKATDDELKGMWSLIKDMKKELKHVKESREEVVKERNDLKDQLEELLASDRERKERYYERQERADMKDPLVSSISGNAWQDRDKYYSHLGWWFTPDKGWSHSGEYGWHKHSYTEVLYVMDGELRIETGEGLNRALPGEKIVVPASTRHRIPSGSPWCRLAIAGGAMSR